MEKQSGVEKSETANGFQHRRIEKTMMFGMLRGGRGIYQPVT